MSQQRFYDFDGYRLDAEDRILLREEEILPLTQKAFDVLLLLVERNGRVVTKDELMNEVWADTIVEEGSLAQNIYTLRKMLGATSTGEDFIKTVLRRGYRFSATVVASGTPEVELPTVELMRQVELKKRKHGTEFQLSNGLAATTEAEAVALPKHSEPPVILPRKSLQKAAVFGVLAIALSVAGWLVYRADTPPAPFSDITLTNLTTTGNVQCVALSPDGKMVACFYAPTTNTPWQPAIFSFETRQLLKAFPQTVMGSPYIRWSPDGQNLVYAENPIGAATLWKQPIAGGARQALLQLEADSLHGFDWSSDGQRLAYVRGLWMQNIVLIKNGK